MKSILNPDTSVMVGLASGAMILGIYQVSMPDKTSIRVSTPHDDDVEAMRKQAAWMSIGVLGFMFLLTRDKNAALIGGLVLGAVDLQTKHANGVNPGTGKLDENPSRSIMPNVYPLPDYQETAEVGAYE